MTLDYPQIVFILLVVFELGIVIAKHGEMKTGSFARYNFWSSSISTALITGILYWGGFFA